MSGEVVRSAMWMSILIGGAAVSLTLLLARSARADTDDATFRKASALVWEMSEWHHEFSDRRRARTITPDKERALAEAAADKFAAQRDKLAALLPKLSPATRFAADLANFVQTWPARDTFVRDLLGPSHGEQSGRMITSLAMQVSDPRRGWKTLFPFFRP